MNQHSSPRKCPTRLCAVWRSSRTALRRRIWSKGIPVTKGVPFSVFARLCIQRKIYSATRSASALKHQPLNQSMSLDRPLFEDLAESHTRVTAPIGDPESLVIGNEEREERTRQLYSLLSEFEANVLTLFLDGLSYEEMAETLGKPVKSVENAIQRIKRKSAKINPC